MDRAMIHWTNDSGEEQRLVFDAVPVEQHSVDNIVTEFPVESGFFVSDHVIRKNRVLQLRLVSTNSTFEGRARQLSYTKGLMDKARGDFEVLQSLVREGILVNLTTVFGDYTNCVITKMTGKTDANIARALDATITVKELNIVGDVLTGSGRKAMTEPPPVEAEYLVAHLNTLLNINARAGG